MATRKTRGSASQCPPMVDQTIDMVLESVSPATLKTYNRTLHRYYEFVASLDCRYPIFPSTKGQVCLFATSLFNEGLSPAAITAKLSAISFVHKLYELCDPVKSFMMRKLLIAFRKRKPQADARLPITPDMLNEMLGAIDTLDLSLYEEYLYKSMLSLSFAGFLRASEITGYTHHLLRDNVKIIKGEIVMRFISYKCSQSKVFILKILPTKMSSCPVVLLRRYLVLRGTAKGPLFVKPSGYPLSYKEFYAIFQCLMACLGLPGKYSPHSLRIGAATHAAATGCSDAQIRLYGRWNSVAFLNYIRFPVVQV